MEQPEKPENNEQTVEQPVKKRGGWHHGTKTIEKRVGKEERRLKKMKYESEIQSIRLEAAKHALVLKAKEAELAELRRKLEPKPVSVPPAPEPVPATVPAPTTASVPPEPEIETESENESDEFEPPPKRPAYEFKLRERPLLKRSFLY